MNPTSSDIADLLLAINLGRQAWESCVVSTDRHSLGNG